MDSILPNALDKLDEDRTIDILAEERRVNPEVLREQDVIDRIREHRAEQDQLIQTLQAGQGAAQIAKDGAQAQQLAGAGV